MSETEFYANTFFAAPLIKSIFILFTSLLALEIKFINTKLYLQIFRNLALFNFIITHFCLDVILFDFMC